MNKASKLISSLAMAGSILALVSGAAQANIAWLTTPVLGFGSTFGPCPAGSGWINCVAVPTDTGTIQVPAVSDPTSSSFGVGLPSQPIFQLDGTAWAGSAVTGSGTFDITFQWSYLGPNPAITAPNTTQVMDEGLSNVAGAVLNHSNYYTFNDFPILDAGLWTYTETWTNISNRADFITASTPFCVNGPAQGVTCNSATSVVPEPGSLALLGLGLAGLASARRKKV